MFMKTNIIIPFFTITLAFFGCSKSQEKIVEEDTPIVISDYTIPADLALADLNAVLRANPEMTKSAEQWGVTSFKTISFPTLTKSGESDNGPKLYVVDLSNGGTAILGADYRAPGVLAILDEGTLTEEDFRKSALYYTKSGIENDSPKEDDLFIPVSQDDFPAFLASYFQDYIETKIDGFFPETRSSTLYYDGKYWTTDEYIPRLLNTVWGQWAPFNNSVVLLHPNCPAGCVATALGQILNYCEYPNQIRSLSLDWEAIGHVYTYINGVFNAGTTMEQSIVSNLMLCIGNDVNMTYNTNGSSASDNDAVSALQYYGFSWVQKHTWANIGNDMDYYVKNCLRGYRPAYYAGMHKFNLFNWTGHAWVVDGLWTMHSGNETMEWYRVNYGWTGSHNGWYRIGVFNPSSEMCSYDTNEGDSYLPNDELASRQYNHFNVAITYEMPS